MIATAAMFLVSSIGWAQTPVVHDSDDVTDVLRRISERTAVPMNQLEGIHIDTLTKRPPTIDGEGSLRHCSGATFTAPELRALELRAETAWRAGEAQEALDQLDLGITQLGCLRERVEKKTATRMFLLRAGLLAHAGNTSSAIEEASSALALTPDVAWDDKLPPEGEPVLAEAKNTERSGSIRVVPRVTTPPWVDGAALPSGAPVSKRPGLHLVQIPSTSGLQSAWLTLQGDATLVLPAGFRAPVLDRMRSSDPALMQLLHATVGDAPTYVASGEGIWFITYTNGTPAIETLAEPLPMPPTEADAPSSKRKRRR